MSNPMFSIPKLREIHQQVIRDLGMSGFKTMYGAVKPEFDALEREGLNTMQALSRLILRGHNQDDEDFNVPIAYLAAVATEILDPDSRVLVDAIGKVWEPTEQ